MEEEGAENREPRLWAYRLQGGWTVLAGKTDRDNDQLSLRRAHPEDWWFHVRGMPGSHVILRVEKGKRPDEGILKRAAAIAAYHSKARYGGVVSVSGTQAKYVRKERGMKPGQVMIRKERTFKVRPAVPSS
jgi:predicted ribosome quality control (RQC) complex YloA/Tae2 family protein